MRGIDTLKGVLYVITPVPQSSLEKVNLLLQGYIQIPTCLLQVSDPHIFSFLYFLRYLNLKRVIETSVSPKCDHTPFLIALLFLQSVDKCFFDLEKPHPW